MDCPHCAVTLLDDGPEASGPIHHRLEAYNLGNPVHTLERCDRAWIESGPADPHGEFGRALKRSREMGDQIWGEASSHEASEVDPWERVVHGLMPRLETFGWLITAGLAMREEVVRVAPDQGVVVIPLDGWRSFLTALNEANVFEAYGAALKNRIAAADTALGVPDDSRAGDQTRADPKDPSGPACPLGVEVKHFCDAETCKLRFDHHQRARRAWDDARKFTPTRPEIMMIVQEEFEASIFALNGKEPPRSASVRPINRSSFGRSRFDYSEPPWGHPVPAAEVMKGARVSYDPSEPHSFGVVPVRELGLSELPPHVGGGIRDTREPKAIRLASDPVRVDNGSTRPLPDYYGLTHLVGEDSLPVCGWRPDESHPEPVAYTGLRHLATCLKCTHPVEIQANGKIVAHAESLDAFVNKPRVLDAFTSQVTPSLPATLEFELRNVVFDGDAPAALGCLANWDSFDVVNGPEIWRGCMLTKYAQVRRRGATPYARASSLHCIARQVAASAPVKNTACVPNDGGDDVPRSDDG